MLYIIVKKYYIQIEITILYIRLRQGVDVVFSNGRKTIGVFVSRANSEYQEQLSNGISSRAQELDYNVAFFTNFGGYGEQDYDKGECKIAHLPYYEKLDGIIMTPDTMDVIDLEKSIKNNIEARSNCPVVSIRRKIDGFYNVLVDDDNVLEDIVRHFVVEHGFTRINFLTGPRNYPESHKRLDSYKKVLTEYNIPIEEERIIYGDFWKRDGRLAVETWLSGTTSRPQAIICANDYMAITVTRELEERGILVPEEIAVSGCDDVIDAGEFSPAITTAHIPITDMGIEAVNKIDRVLRGIKEEYDSYIETSTIIRESCGCKYSREHEKKESNKYYFRMTESLLSEVVRNAFMSVDLTGITSIEDINEKLFTHVYANEGFSDFFMCLYTDWQYTNKKEPRQFNPDEEMSMEVGITNGKNYSKIRFPRCYLIPPQFKEDKPLIYYFSILHHQSIDFGYVAIAFEKIQSFMYTFQAWMINVGNALENVRVHNELNRLVYELEDMYIRDELTGLYNRRGLETLGDKYIKQAAEKNISIMVLSADLDRLKLINDNYGHAGGDIALKAVGDALFTASDDDEICVRFGGDEFVVIGLEYNKKRALDFIQRFIAYLDEFNKSGKHKFKVYVSYGWSIINPTEKTTVEECLINADKKMYDQKHKKRALRIRANLI